MFLIFEYFLVTLLCVVVNCIDLHDTSELPVVTKHICNMQRINASCPVDTVIIVQRAFYGRMKVNVELKCGMIAGYRLLESYTGVYL